MRLASMTLQISGAALRSRLQRLLRSARASGPEGEAVLTRRNVYILPTRHGLLFALVLMAMLLGAMNYNNNLAFLLTFVLGSLAVVTILHGYRDLAGLVIRAGEPPVTFAGSRAVYTLGLENASGWPRFALRLRGPDGDETTVDVAARSGQRATLSRPAPHRGYLPLGRCTLMSTYPLGLFRVWSYLEFDRPALVYPQPGPALPLPGGQRGDRERGRGGGGGADDFAGLRAYQHGDSPRHIHWRAAARSEELLTKKFVAQGGEELWLELDQAPGTSLEEQLSQLCRWVLDAEAGGHRYGLRLPGTTLAPSGGSDHMHQCLRALALFGGPA